MAGPLPAPAAPRAERLRHRIERRLTALWFAPSPRPDDRWLRAALQPLAWLAGLVARRRRQRHRQLSRDARPVVVVVGNLLVGGTGKTPAVVAIARGLAERGLRVGLLASGYRATDEGPHRVRADSDPVRVGDEAVLLARATGLPVASGRRRRAALDLLVADAPDLDVVVSDDGLQHFALPRGVQLAVFDGRGAGNGRMLPAGPLREPLSAAADLDALLLNGTPRAPVEHPVQFGYRVHPTVLRRVTSAGSNAASTPSPAYLTLSEFRQRHARRRVLAIAGIADPTRFFRLLDDAAIAFSPVPLPDHARLDARWLQTMIAGDDDTVLVMTDKDAVKLPASGPLPECWALEVAARFDAGFFDWLMRRLPLPTASTTPQD